MPLPRRSRALLALTALATSSLFIVGAGVAHADNNGTTDPRGDVADPRGDLISAVGTYSNDFVGLGMTVASPEDPRTAYNWTYGGSDMWWTIATSNGAQFDVFVNNWPGTGFNATIYNDADFNEVPCNAQPGFTNGTYEAFFPGECIGHPASFRFSAVMAYDDKYGGGGMDFDNAPDSGGLCCTVNETAPATITPPATQPPATTEPQPILTDASTHSGYWMLTLAGNVYNFGSAPDLGGGVPGSTHIEPTSHGNGYWVLGGDGTVTPHGDASLYGKPTLQPGEIAMSLSATPTSNGYWVFTNRGRVLPFGDALSFGDMSGTRLNGPVLGSVATPTGKGYYMVASDGGIFAFGDAAFHGSTGSMTLNKPVMSMAPSADGAGYWLVASDGGIFAFDVPFYGSMGAAHLNKPISGMVAQPGGYMMVAQDGGIFAFGQTQFHGSLGNNPPASSVISAALQP